MTDDNTIVEDVTDEEPTDLSGAEDADLSDANGTDPSENADESDAVRKVRREAKNLRTRLRNTEAERDALTTQLHAMRTKEVARIAGTEGGMADGNDLLIECEVDGMLAKDGSVDPKKVIEACRKTIVAHPHWSAEPEKVRRKPTTELRTSGRYGLGFYQRPDWSALIEKAAR